MTKITKDQEAVYTGEPRRYGSKKLSTNDIGTVKALTNSWGMYTFFPKAWGGYYCCLIHSAQISLKNTKS
jgi:hypothetical protein